MRRKDFKQEVRSVLLIICTETYEKCEEETKDFSGHHRATDDLHDTRNCLVMVTANEIRFPPLQISNNH